MGQNNRNNRPTQMACVVFMDVVASTSLVQNLSLYDYGDLMSEMLQVGYLRVALSGGRVLQHQGDAIVALFDMNNIAGALQLAMQCHKNMSNLQTAQRLGVSLQFRVGIASGEVISLNDADGVMAVYGLPVNLSRRICSCAEPGSTWVCQHTYTFSPQHASFQLVSDTIIRDFSKEKTYAFMGF